MATVMWEARAADGQIEQLVAHIRAHTDPTAEIYRSAPPDERIVVIDNSGRGVPDVPADLVARPPHFWAFERVAR